MDWINLHTSTLDSAEFVGADPTCRATWLCLLRYCCGQENGGRVVDCASWSDRRWQQLARVTKREVTTASDLWTWDGDDLVVWAYPVDKEEEIQTRREIARENGRKGGRPIVAKRRKPTSEPTPEPTSVNSAKAEGNGMRMEGNGMEGIEEASASSCSELSLSLGSDPAPENGTPTHPTLFPVIGNPEPVQILESKAAEYRATFTGIDVNAELLKAAQWLRDNASRRKTAKGLHRFLFAWLERAQNNGRTNGQQVVAGAQRVQGAAKLSDFAPRPSLGALQIELRGVKEEIADILHPGGCTYGVEPQGAKRTRYDALIARRDRIQAQMEGLT